MKSFKAQEAVSGLNRPWGRSCLFVAALLLAGAVEATIATVQAGEKDDLKTLRQLEDDMAQAWVLRDGRALNGILADDYTLGGAGDSFVNKEEYVAGVDDPESRTTSVILDDLRIRVYDDAAVVTGRAVYRGWSKQEGNYVHRFRFTDTFIRRDGAWKCVATHASGLPSE